MRHKIYLLNCLALLMFIVVLILIVKIGDIGRKYGVPGDSGSMVTSTQEACEILKKRGYHGRVLISFSRYLHFMPIISKSNSLPSAKQRPGSVNLGDLYFQQISYKNFLWVLSRVGTARRVYNVLPKEVYQEKVQDVQNELYIGSEGIEIDDMGSKRIVTSFLPSLTESAIVVIDSSFFEKVSVEDFLNLFQGVSGNSDGVIFNLAEDNPDISEAARLKLRQAAGITMTTVRRIPGK